LSYLLFILFSVLSVFSAFGEVNPLTIPADNSKTVDIKVVITNIKSQKGIIRIGVFNNSKSFLNKGEEFMTLEKRPSGETLVFYLIGLKKDDYAISLYHDVNSDDKCNMNLLLRPTEPIGFSNNVKLKLFKPSFEDCKFTANSDMEITIRLTDLQ